MTRLIKRYGNRKLYDPQTSAYVTLDGVTALVRDGQDVRVIDNDSGEDLTSLIFSQIIVEEEKRKNGMLSVPVLRWIIKEGEERFRDLLDRVERGREAIDNVREIAEKSVERLVRGGEKRGRALIGDILETPQRQLDALQRQIDTQVRRSVKRFADYPTVKRELLRIQDTLHNLQKQIGAPQRRARGKPAKRPRRRAHPN